MLRKLPWQGNKNFSLMLFQKTLKHADELLLVAQTLAEIVFFIMGKICREREYYMPEFLENSTLLKLIRAVILVELVLKESLGLAGTHAFVPNDCNLSSDVDQMPSSQVQIWPENRHIDGLQSLP